MRSPTPADLLQYARLMNGTCERCGRILPHPASGKVHRCNPDDLRFTGNSNTDSAPAGALTPSGFLTPTGAQRLEPRVSGAEASSTGSSRDDV